MSDTEPTVDLLPEEATYIRESGRCVKCGHLEALHNDDNEYGIECRLCPCRDW